MGDDDDDGDDLPPGFGEGGDPAARIKLMDDATLLHVHRALNNPKVLTLTSDLGQLLDEEIRTRGLMPLN